MAKSANGPVIYDFHTKALYDAAYSRRDQSSDHNFKGIPAIIVGTDDYETLQCVDVRAAINDLYIERDNLVLESLTLKKVFVSLPFSGGFKVKSPVSIGDPVRLSWAHRDLGGYLDSDGSGVDVNINEIAQIEDCWVTLNGGTRKNHTNPSTTDMIIEGPNTEIRITPEGVFTAIHSGTSYIKSSHHTIDTDLTVTGNLIVQGTSNLIGMVTAPAGVAAASYAGTGASVVMLGNVTIGGIVVNGHTHTNPEGGDVGPMK
jgi:hypothetical protein